jgi:peptide/nickel transport system substrate-binding protein
MKEASVKRRALLSGVIALTLAGGVVACSGDGGDDGSANQPPAKAGVNDITVVPRDQVNKGKQLVWPVSDIPATFNMLHLDGNLADTAYIMEAAMPQIFLTDAAGNPVWNKDYLAEEPKLETSPKQKITYKINDKAKWNDGTPITWADFEAQWKTLNGKDKAFSVNTTTGYELIESVARGASDTEVVVTYAENFADWEDTFVPLYPKSSNSSADVFNTGWNEKMGGPTAGPFKFATLDKTAKTVTLERDPAWWGNEAKLDRIIYKGIEDNARADAVDNGESDFFEIASNVNSFNRAKQMADKIDLKRAGAPNWRHITVNGSKPHLADAKVRQALAMAINRETIAKALLGPLGQEPKVLNNRIYMGNHANYKDNSGDIGKYNPDKAKQQLDEAGWKVAGAGRAKDGVPLAIDFVIPGNVAQSKAEAELIAEMLKQVNVPVTIRTVPVGDLFDTYLTPGQYDMTVFSYIGDAFPVSDAASIYLNPVKKADGSLDIQQNFSRIGSPEIDEAARKAAAELDEAKAADAGNQFDGKLWEMVQNIPMYQRPDLWGVRKGLANFGAFAYADPVYEDIGWTT